MKPEKYKRWKFSDYSWRGGETPNCKTECAIIRMEKLYEDMGLKMPDILGISCSCFRCSPHYL